MQTKKGFLRGFAVAMASLLIVSGIAFALTRLTEVDATVNVTVIGEGLVLYEDEARSQLLDSIDFGDAETDPFGTQRNPVSVPVWVLALSLIVRRVGRRSAA